MFACSDDVWALVAAATALGGGAREMGVGSIPRASSFSSLRRALRLYYRKFQTVSICRVFETFSFLPPLSETEISNQVEYIMANGWTTCLEFTSADKAYVKDKSNIRFCKNGSSCVRLPSLVCSNPRTAHHSPWMPTTDCMDQLPDFLNTVAVFICSYSMCSWYTSDSCHICRDFKALRHHMVYAHKQLCERYAGVLR